MGDPLARGVPNVVTPFLEEVRVPVGVLDDLGHRFVGHVDAALVGRRVLDVGAQRRFFTGALRRAIEIRDRTCFHPSCDEVPERPEVDHIHEASKGGETTQANGRYGCRFHNLWAYRHPNKDSDPDADPARPSD